MPRFSVITSCYNSSKFIKRVYNSLLNQTYNDFEWIVINDCSSDTTLDILKSFRNEDKIKITIIDNERNIGVCDSYNKGFNVSKGSYIYYLDHDDEVPTDALKILNFYWEKYEDSDIGSISGMCANQDGEKIGKELPVNPFISDYFKVYFELGFDSERLFCYRNTVVKEFPFDTDKYGMQAGMMHHGPPALKYKTIFINEVIKIYYPNVGGSMTKQGRKKYSYGTYNNYVFWVNEAKYRVKGRFVLKVRWHFAQVLYGLIAKLTLTRILGDVKRIENKLLSLVYYPFALVMYLYFVKTNKI